MTPLLYLRLGEATGTRATDETGNTAGTYAGGFELGKPSGMSDRSTSVKFYAQLQGRVTVPHRSGLNLRTGAGRTWSIVFRMQADYAAVKTWPGIASKGTAAQGWILFRDGETGALGFQIMGLAHEVLTPPGMVSPLGSWAHWALTYDGAAIRWYKNGVLVATTPLSAALTPTNAAPLVINRAEHYGDNTLDEVAIFSTALTPGQVQSLATAQTAAVTTATTGSPDPGLFFKRSVVPSRRKLFAHYFSPNPRSIDNQVPSGDYYAIHYLAASGESGKHANYGGWLRDRPLERAPITGDYLLEDMKAEIRAAQTMGVDGFFVNIMSIVRGDAVWTRYLRLVDAAVALNSGFYIIPMIDTATAVNNNSAVEVAAALDYFIGKSCSYHTESGGYLISCFKAEGKTPTQWQALMSAIEARHPAERVVFAAILLNANQSNVNTYAPISEYLGSWTVGADVNILNSASNQAAMSPVFARSAGKKWCGQSLVARVQPYTASYDESLNSGVIRASWNKIIRDSSDMVQAITWNDFTEGTQHAPSVAHGWAPLAITAYYAEKWKTGSFPAIQEDALFLSHRDQPLTGATYRCGQTRLMSQSTWHGSSVATPSHRVELLSYLTAPATITVTIGGTAQGYEAPAGEFVKTFDAANGSVSAVLTRNGTQQTSVTSAFPIGTRPVSQDRQYFFASSLHGTGGQHSVMRL
ncbi:MAG TPA: endo-1,3-alpha-glucanase family glycosylhydrolase [Propionibacteriaceae bacterium]|nr:endo-1,3-alpha-glucanase family glycosylhydrolase [Propionibacteriaceae bacterium]